MRITYYAEYDYNGNLVKWIGDDGYEGPLELCKGGASKAEQARADALTAQQNALMNQSLGLQQMQLGAVNTVVDPMIARGGMSADQENALTSLLTNQLGNTYRSGMGMVNQNLVARGLTGGQTGAGGGGVAGDFEQMAAMLGGQQQQGLSQIQLEKAAQLQGLLGLKMGIGSQYGANVGNFTSGMNASLGHGIEAARNADQAATSWMGPVFGALAGVGGSAITKYCWIASECYGGWDEPRTKFVRFRLGQLALRSKKYLVITVIYAITGKYIAKFANRYSSIREYFKNRFDNFIEKQRNEMLNELIK